MARLLTKKALLGAASIAALVFAMVSGRGIAGPGDPPPPPPTEAEPEPITGDPSWPEPGDETGPIHPFDPEPNHPSDVPLGDLTAEEQAYVVAGQDVTGWDAIHDAFGQASVEAGEKARAEAASQEAGIGGLLGSVGVVP